VRPAPLAFDGGQLTLATMTDSPPDGVSPGLAAALEACDARAHHLYFERNDWAGALLQWQIRSRLGPPTLESQLALAHCKIAVGTADDLPVIGIADATAPSNGRRLEYTQLIRTCVWAALTSGDAVRTSRLARLAAAVDPHFRSIYEQQILPGPADAPIDVPDPPTDPEPLPFERALTLSADAARAGLAAHAGKRVLIFMPHMAMTPGGLVEVTVCRYLRSSLEALQIDHRIFESHRLTPEERADLPARLRRVIEEFRPDVIVCYDMMISGASTDPEVQHDIRAVLHEARRRLGAKTVYTYSDTWYDNTPALLDALVDDVDVFHIIFPGLLPRVSPRVIERIFCYPYPCSDPRPPGAPAPARRAGAGFVGSLSWANQSRVVWYAEIGRAALPIDVNFHNVSGFRTPAEYAELVASYPISIDFTARISGDQVLTLRTIEAPWYGSLLLSEAAPDIAYFMRPFEHYVPFATLAQLAGRLRILLENQPLRERITRAGTAWVQRNFGAQQFWARLFGKLDERPPVSAAPPAPRSGMVQVRLPFSHESYGEVARPLVPGSRQ
jgi:hypothetical protein